MGAIVAPRERKTKPPGSAPLHWEVRLDLMLARRKMRLTELSERVGISLTNLSLLKTGKVKAIRFSTLAALCRELDCQPGDLLEFLPEAGQREEGVAP